MLPLQHSWLSQPEGCLFVRNPYRPLLDSIELNHRGRRCLVCLTRAVFPTHKAPQHPAKNEHGYEQPDQRPLELSGQFEYGCASRFEVGSVVHCENQWYEGDGHIRERHPKSRTLSRPAQLHQDAVQRRSQICNDCKRCDQGQAETHWKQKRSCHATTPFTSYIYISDHSELMEQKN